VDLVEERPPDPAAVAAQEGARPVPVVFEDEAIRTAVRSALEAVHVPSVVREDADPRGALWIPLAYVPAAHRVLSQGFPALHVDWTADGGRVRRAQSVDPARIVDDAVLRLRPAEVLERGEEAWKALDRCLRSGTDAVLVRAGLLLRRLGDPGLERLASALREAVEAADEERARGLLRELVEGRDRRRAPWPHGVARLSALLESGETPRRGWGALVAGRLRLREAYAKLVALLTDPDPGVAVAADEALIEITDEDLGFDPDLDRAEIERIVEERKRWASEPRS
jgi:hypothetical protein